MSEDELVRECDRKINEYCKIGGKIMLTHFARDMGYNPSYLSRTYKRVTGNNLKEYFQTKKMEYAKELLRKGYSVTYVATHFGYSKNGFTKAYRKATGENPSYVNKKTKGEE